MTASKVIALLKRAWKANRGVILFLIVEAFLQLSLGLSGGEHGLVTPDGRVDPLAAILIGAALITRLAVWFIVGPILVYRLLAWAARLDRASGVAPYS